MYISGSYYISPSGCVHYVTCIGNRYMLQTYIDTYYITYDYMIACNVHIGTYIISAHLAVCIMWPVLGTGTCCKLISTHIISLMIIWLHVMYISEHILYQPIWLCALCSLYWEQVHAAKLISNTYYITCDYMIACNVHIATCIISVRLAVCIM
jgi:hypothetical protein